MSGNDNEELIDYEDEQDVIANGATASTSNGGVAGPVDGDDKEKKNFSGIHSTGFRSVKFENEILDWFIYAECRDFLLKPELLRAISDLGFEHPSEGE